MTEPSVITALRNALQQPLPGRDAQERMAGRVRMMPKVIPEDARASAVLALLYPVNDAPHLLFIRRTEDGRAHGGQISFPGGRQEEADADLMTTALREAHEEVGIDTTTVEILGALTPLYIPVSNFLVHPFVGWSSVRPKNFRLSEDEVAGILELPLADLLHPQRKETVEVRPSSAPGMVLNVPAYRLADGTIIWGATAMIFSELEACLPG